MVYQYYLKVKLCEQFRQRETWLKPSKPAKPCNLKMVGMFLVFNVCKKALQTIQTNKQFKTWNMILLSKQFRHRATWNLVEICSLETQPGFASQLFALKEIELYSNIKQISRLKMVASSVLLCGTNWPGWDPYLIFVFVVTDMRYGGTNWLGWDQLTEA